MLILAVGAKGGVGTTRFVEVLLRSARLVGLDAADGTLAARLGWATYPLDAVVGWGERRLIQEAQRLVRRRPVLLWNAVCDTFPQPLRLVEMVARLGTVVVDGGIEPPDALWKAAGHGFIVSLDDPAALYHETYLKAQWSKAHGGAKAVAVVGNVEEAARALARDWFGAEVRPPKAPAFLRGVGIKFK